MIEKVIHDKKLTSSNWEILIRFFAAQDLRTPISYIESVDRWKENLPVALENTLKKAVAKLRKSASDEQSNQTTKKIQQSHDLWENVIKVSVKRNDDSRDSFVEASVVVGRELWLAQQRYLLTNTVNALLRHNWRIVKPANGKEWFTSDHPVVKLNYYSEINHDFKGGWGRPGTDLLLPLSPNHLLFTEIGSENLGMNQFSDELTTKIQLFIAERAFRWIFARKIIKNVSNYRPRRIDPETFLAETEAIKDWHKAQSKAERGSDDDFS